MAKEAAWQPHTVQELEQKLATTRIPGEVLLAYAEVAERTAQKFKFLHEHGVGMGLGSDKAWGIDQAETWLDQMSVAGRIAFENFCESTEDYTPFE